MTTVPPFFTDIPLLILYTNSFGYYCFPSGGVRARSRVGQKWSFSIPYLSVGGCTLLGVYVRLFTSLFYFRPCVFFLALYFYPSRHAYVFFPRVVYLLLIPCLSGACTLAYPFLASNPPPRSSPQSTYGDCNAGSGRVFWFSIANSALGHDMIVFPRSQALGCAEFSFLPSLSQKHALYFWRRADGGGNGAASAWVDAHARTHVRRWGEGMVAACFAIISRCMPKRFVGAWCGDRRLLGACSPCWVGEAHLVALGEARRAT